MYIYRFAIQNVRKLLTKEIIFPTIPLTRNTHIVRRVVRPPTSRIDAERPRVLKRKHFLYETIEDTDLTPPPDLRVVLTTFVDGVGDTGDVISCDAFYARNQLLLPKKAVYATPENIDKYSRVKKSAAGRPKYSSVHAVVMVKTLSTMVIPVFMNAEQSWTLDPLHICIAFRAQGIQVPKDSIQLPSTPIEGPNSTIEGGDFAVTVTINNTEQVPVRCRLFHIQQGLETAKLSDELFLDKNEPILEEQKELLEAMPMPEIVNDPSKNISLVEKYRIQYLK